ncbi:MAG: STAS domain-containing protein [Spirochaetaceae bacterium]|jgi:anti-sigma B factor antagonist|nr:STAS domain-containing protein [Spirochaetaceae bacterium]
MELEVREQDGIQIITGKGWLDMGGSVELKNLFMKLAYAQADRFIINLKGLSHIDSSGVGALIFIASTARKLSLQFVLTETPEQVMWVIEKVRLKGYLPFTESMEEAFDKLNGELLPEL